MRRLWVAVAVVVVSVVLVPTSASAKGPVDAVLRGPHVLSTGVAKLDRDTAMELAQATSLYAMLDSTGASDRVERVSSGRLGPRYVVTFQFEVGEGSAAHGAKRITVMVVVGNDATPQRHAEVYAVLDSLR